MIISLQQLVILLPIIFISLTVIILIISISLFRNSIINIILTIFCLIVSLFSLYFFSINDFVDVMLLTRFDNFSRLHIALILLISLFTSILFYSFLKNNDKFSDEFYILLLISTLGCILFIISNNLVSFFIGLELISIPFFGMLSYHFDQKKMLEVCMKYIILSIISSSFILLGIALLYAQTGKLTFFSLNKAIVNMQIIEPILLTSFVMILIGICFKLSIFPFHLWTADVYQKTFTPTLVFLSTAIKISIFLGIIRLFVNLLLTNNKIIKLLLEIISIISIIYGNIIAINQDSFKKTLGYSSIVHFGYLLLGLTTLKIDNILIIKIISLYVLSYILSNLGIFSIISFVENLFYGKNTDSILFYNGLFWDQPLIALLFIVLFLSLSGLPITVGFISKIFIILFLINNSLSYFFIFFIFGIVIGFIYYLRIILVLFSYSLDNRFKNINFYRWLYSFNGIVSFLCVFIIILLGLYPNLFFLLFNK